MIQLKKYLIGILLFLIKLFSLPFKMIYGDAALFKNTPSIYYLEELRGPFTTQTEINGKWVPARPIGYYSILNRLKCSWLVFKGECDIFRWPEKQ